MLRGNKMSIPTCNDCIKRACPQGCVDNPISGYGTENFDPNDPVCQNQNDFNQAFRSALKYNNKQNNKNSQPWVWVYLAMYVIFFVWAIILALTYTVPGPGRTLHVTLAMVFSPFYVLAYYFGMLNPSM